ncbi:MAG TPA: hypothetical protein VF250_10960 [Conexibacter sp.]
MTGGRRLADALTALAARAYPRARRTDARVVRDCAREAIAAEGTRALLREPVALVAAGLRARVGEAALELGRAPWRAALGALTLPLAAALLLVWTFGFVPRYDHWPLGEGWALLLGGSLAAVVGAALRSRRLTAGGAAATFVAAAAPYLGYGTESALSYTPSFFLGRDLDVGAASLLPALLLVAGGLALPRGCRPSAPRALARLAAGLLPSAVAAVALLPYATPKPTVVFTYLGPGRAPAKRLGAPSSMPWLPPSSNLLAILGIALAVAVVTTWWHARARPERALATGLVLASVAYPLAWAATRTDALGAPWWLLNSPYPQLLAALPALLALALMRRAGRRS